MVLQVCAVVITLTLVVLAFAAARALSHFAHAADALSATTVEVRRTLEEVQTATHEAHELVATLQSVVPYLTSTASRVAALGNRVTDISSAVLDEVERPIHRAISVSTGVRTGANLFLKLVRERLAPRPRATNGGTSHA